MIQEVNGNLLDSNERVIAHQVNCKGRMSSGVALVIRNRYPEAYAHYLQFTAGKDPQSLLGNVLFTPCKDGKIVAHLFGQLDYGTDKQYTDYAALSACLTKLSVVARNNGYAVAMPLGIGCGRGGGDWSIVCQMIEEAIGGEQITLYKLREET